MYIKSYVMIKFTPSPQQKKNERKLLRQNKEGLKYLTKLKIIGLCQKQITCSVITKYWFIFKVWKWRQNLQWWITCAFNKIRAIWSIGITLFRLLICFVFFCVVCFLWGGFFFGLFGFVFYILKCLVWILS